MPDSATLSSEQSHFDRAYDARERKRSVLRGAHLAAGGNRAVAGEVKRGADAALAKIGREDEPVAFGRIDLDGETLYLGKHAITTEGRDVLVVNWKLPAVEAFYKANISDPLGVSLKRQFQTDGNTIVDFEDIVFGELAEAVGELVDRFAGPIDDALLRDLEASRDGEMRDIVQTIHHSQYELISRALDQLMVVQGGPGTGKTAVALHRVSWLLYQHQSEISPGEVMVIGPSKTFTNYINKVLPALGDEGVTHGDLLSLGPLSSDRREEPDETKRIKGEARMSGLIRRALWQRARLPQRDEEVFTLGVASSSVTFTAPELDATLASIKEASKTYRGGRDSFREWIANMGNERLNDQRNRVRGARLSLQPSTVDAFVERFWPNLTAAAFLQDLLGSQQRLVAAAGTEFNADEVLLLQRQASARISDERWSDSDVALLDEADRWISGLPHQFKHIVVDEAQDLSPMQLRSVLRRSSNRSMTVVGDIAQSTSVWARDSWDSICSDLSSEDRPALLEELEFGYRVPREHFDVAAKLLPQAAPTVKAPTIVRSAPVEPGFSEVAAELVVDTAVARAQEHAGRGCSVAIITSDALRDGVADKLNASQIRFADARNGSVTGSINLMTSEEAKGLEFDAVVVVEPADIVDDQVVGARRLYIALTRSTSFLELVGSKPLPIIGFMADEPTASPPNSPDVLTDEPPRAMSGEPRSRVVSVLAQALAFDIKQSVVPSMWAEVVDAIRDELDLGSNSSDS